MHRRWLAPTSGSLVIAALVAWAQGGLLKAETSTTYCFSSGANETGFDFCLSSNGNITLLRSPVGGSTEHIRVGVITEGYAVCDSDDIAYDYGSSVSVPGIHRAAFGPTTVVSGCAGGSLPCTLQRDTANGKYRLKMVFNWNTIDKEINITTTLTNLQSVPANNVVLMRFADADVEGTFEDIGDISRDSSWARQGPGPGLRLGLSALTPKIPHWVALQGPNPPTDYLSCINDNIAATPYQGDVGLLAGYDFSQNPPYYLGAGKSKTVKFQYRRD